MEKQVWVGCKPVSSSLDLGSVCVQVSGVYAVAGMGRVVQQVQHLVFEI